MEGDTEKEFYLTLLNFLCEKHKSVLTRRMLPDEPDIVYEIQRISECCLIKFDVVGAITSIPKAGKWFNSQCVRKYGAELNWMVFLCYDADNYKADVSKFHEGDWAVLRGSLKKASRIFDIAAAADIEDVMLNDLTSVCRFLECETPKQLHGRKGKGKMKNLFRDNGRAYHEGVRANALIKSLDMQSIMDSGVIPLSHIENSIFTS